MRLLLLILVLTFAGCPCNQPPREPSPDIDQCPAACGVLKDKCPRTRLSQDKPCDDACRQIENSGYITINPSCIAKAKDPDEVRACNVQCDE